MRHFATLVFGLVLVSASLAQALPVKRTFVAGGEIRYKLRMELMLFGEPAIYTSVVAEKAAEAGDSTLVDLVTSDYKASLFGDEVTLNDSDLPKIRHRISPSGEVVEILGDMTLPSSYRMAALRSVLLPSSPVNVGEKYTVAGKADKEKGLEARSWETTYEAVEEVSGLKTARLALSYKETSGATPATATGKAWIDLANGQIVKLELDFQNAPIPGSTEPISGKLLYERA